MAKSNFIVRGGADFSGIKNEIEKTQKQFKKFQFNLSSGLKTIGKLTGLAIGAKALVDFGKASIEVASDLREVQNVVDVTFGHMAKEVDEFAANAREQFGLSELSAKQYASTMGAMLKSSGIAGEAVKDMAIEITKLTADMASFYNLEGDEAFRKIRAGISGETEPLKQLGINMSVANMEAYAMSQGINKAWKEMTQAEQTMLRYNYLLAVTTDAQGDFARESGTWANQVKILKEQWQEFMSLIGKALIEVLLPVVKFLNKVLELLIKIVKAIGKIYSMITGKNVAVETNLDISDSAEEAADSELDLADGIGKAAKAAKKALAPFDELNILQQNLASGGGAGSGIFDGLNNINQGKLDTTLSTEQVDNSLEESKRKWEGFFIWIGDWWNRLRQAFAIPIYVPAPIFAAIPDPIYEPNWGLELPPIEKPVFQPIPDPVYQPNWGLDVPGIPAPVFPPIPSPVYEPVWNLVPPPVPAVDYREYSKSLETMKTETSNIFNTIKTNVSKEVINLQNELSKTWEGIRKDTETVTGRIMEGLKKAWGTVETNFNTHKNNVGIIATGIATTLVTNINSGLTTVGKNINKTIETVQNNLQTFGRNVATVAAETAKGFVSNLNEGFKTAASNFATFANSVGQNLRAFGSGFLRAAAETARGFVDNMVSGFSTVWNNFKDLMSSLGERVSGWFRENKSMVIKTTIAAGVVVGAGALALAAPAAIPYVAGALGGLASIPALAKGGITNGPMLAMIGDNPGGKEVVSPLDDLVDMIQTAVNNAVATNNSASDTNATIILQIGETELGRTTIKAINKYQRQVGRTLLEV